MESISIKAFVGFGGEGKTGERLDKLDASLLSH